MEKKISIVLSGKLEQWQALNIASHLSVAVGRYAGQEIMGRHPLVDASRIEHTGISKYPIVILKATEQQLRDIVQNAKEKDGLLVADFPREMLDTYTDDELVRTMKSREETSFEYLGVALLGPAQKLKDLTGFLKLWN